MGLSFFIVVTASGYPTHFWGPQKSLRDDIINQLTKVPSAVKEKSLYAGAGFGQFLVMGKVGHTQFRTIFDKLVNPINQAGLSQSYQARTYTHICTAGLVDFQDRIPTWSAVAGDGSSLEHSIEDYLREDESKIVEVKGSAFVNLERWIETRKPAFDENLLREGVLKAIAGMLNADGGTVIVGAVETKQKSFQTAIKNGRLNGYSIFDSRYIVLGLEPDFVVSGSSKDWDDFSRGSEERYVKLLDLHLESG